MWTYNQTEYLCHFGVPGMKWGVRRSTGSTRVSNKRSASDDDKAARQAKIKKAVKVGAVVAGTALAAYGAKKSSRLCAI